MKTRTREGTRVPAHMRAIGATVAHPTEPHLWARPGSTLYVADLRAIIDELAREGCSRRAC